MSQAGTPGRNPIYDSRMTTLKVTLPEEFKDHVRDIGDGNLSKGVREAIEFHIDNADTDE